MFYKKNEQVSAEQMITVWVCFLMLIGFSHEGFPGSTSWYANVLPPSESAVDLRSSKNGLTAIFGGFVAYVSVSCVYHYSTAYLITRRESPSIPGQDLRRIRSSSSCSVALPLLSAFAY